MDVALMTNCIYSQMPEYARLTDTQKAIYCRKNGLSWLCMRSNPRPDSHPVWGKPFLIAWALEQYDWCVWMDADAVPVKMDFDLEDFLAEVDKPLVMARDINGWNAGVFAVRRDAKWWLHEIDSRRHRYTRGFREQQAISDSIAAGEIEVFEPPREIGWNDYLPILYNRHGDPNVFEQGRSWCLHLPAVKDARRAEIFAEALK